MATRSTRATARTGGALPDWLDRYRRLGLYGLGAGTVLCVAALFTNPVPDPSFPWLALPPELRLPVRQPRIEHWPVTYTVGIWLWVCCFPALFLEGYERLGRDRPLGAELFLVGLPTLAMLGWTTYCRFLWPKLHPPTWNAPAYTFVCWAYCASYEALWSDLAYAIALLGVAATLLAVWRREAPTTALLAFGVLSLPLGLPALFEGWRRAATASD